MSATQKRYRVTLSLCYGKAQPLPIPGFPELPVYRKLAQWPAESKKTAFRRMKLMATNNPGHLFSVEEDRA